MKIYVANTTKQVQQFHFRVVENPRLMMNEIPIGSQIRLYKDDASPREIDSLIYQLENYGAVRADSVQQTKQFIGLCYSVDKPVRDVTIMLAVNHNDDVLQERGYEIRKQAAVAVNDALSKVGDLKGTTVSFKEETKVGEDAPTLNETIEVRARGSDSPKPARRRKAA